MSSYLRVKKQAEVNSPRCTMISDLPDLMDVGREQHSSVYPSHPGDHDPKYNKFLRNHHIPPQQSGMVDQPMSYVEEAPTLPMIPNYYHNQPDCISVSEHCHNCPVCKKMYSPDHTLYIIAIVILAIICILLLKKVLDAQ